MQEIQFIYRINKRATRVILSIGADGKVVVTLPSQTHKSAAEKFINSKMWWIKSKLASLEKKKQNTTAPASKALPKSATHKIITEKVNKYVQKLGVAYNKITIRKQRSRWGSCSRTGNLNFNSNITKLPEDLIDYIVVHEVCHLLELNHSKRFWALVKKLIPDYWSRNKKLKLYQST